MKVRTFSFNIGPDKWLAAMGADDAHKLADWKKRTDEPTGYLGGHGIYRYFRDSEKDNGVEVDAGLQYGNKGNGIIDGWEIFMRASPVGYMNPTNGSQTRYSGISIIDPNHTGVNVWVDKWHSQGLSIEHTLKYDIDEETGQMSLDFTGINGKAYFYEEGEPVFVTTSATQPPVSTPTNPSLKIRLNSVRDIEAGDMLQIGTSSPVPVVPMNPSGLDRSENDRLNLNAGLEEFTVEAVEPTTNLVTVDKPIAVVHPTGSLVYVTLMTKAKLDEDVEPSTADTVIKLDSMAGMSNEAINIMVGTKQ